MDGSVISGFVGADVGRGRWLGGAALSVSKGEGDFSLLEDDDRGDVESSLTAVYPYARFSLTEKVDVWGLAGYGTGDLTLTLSEDNDRTEAETYETDIGMRMGAVGARGEVLSPAGPGGLAVAVRSDAFWVRTTSDAVPGLEASEADVSRLRLVVEGSRGFEMGSGRLVPTLEVGLRHDAGDADSGTGVEAGARFRYASGSVTVAGSVRTLVAHEQTGYEEWGASASVRIDPGASGRGLSLTVAPGWGAASSGVERLWSLADARGLARDSEFEAGRRFEAEVGYGLGLRPLGVLTPYAGLSLADGGRVWRSGARWAIAPGAALALEGTRTHDAENNAPAHALMLRASMRW